MAPDHATPAERTPEQRLLDALTRTSAHFVYIVDLDQQTVTSRNQSVLRELGYTVPDTQPLAGLARFVHPDDRYVLSDVLEKWAALADGDVCDRERRLLHADGSYRWFLGRETVLSRHPDGRVSEIVGTLLDVTRARRAEEAARDELAEKALRSSEALLRGITEAVTPRTGPDFFTSLARHLTDACRVDYAFVGMVDEAVPWIGRAIAVSHRGTIVDPFSYNLHNTPCEHVVGKRLCHYPTGVQLMFPGDRALIDMGIDSYMGIPLFSGTGKPLGLIVLMDGAPIPEPEQAEMILRFVAVRASAELERELAEKALRESEARHSAILESSLDGLIVFGVEGAVLDYNAAAESMFGRPRADAIGRNVADVIMPEALSARHGRSLLRYVDAQTQGVTGLRIEMPAARPDGTEFRVELSVVPIAGVEPTLYAAVVRDITERLMLEGQLRQSQKLQAIGQLAGGVAHDFNNLLTVIMGYSDVLLSTLLPADPAHEAAQHIHDAGERATLLTRQLLMFGRKAILEPRPLDINAVLQHTGTMLRRLIGEDVTFATVLAPGLGLTRIDRGQIEQVIINLCLNSRDAMPYGGRITVETRLASFDAQICRSQPAYQPGCFVELSVSDTGTGMTPDVLTHLFEPFFTTKGLGKGTGLGLATVYGIVQQAGGFIKVDSQPGAGTTFHIFLPREEKVEVRSAARMDETVPAGQGTVLLVEDEDGVRRLAKLSLERHGYTVLAAGSGHEAITLASGYPGSIDVLVTDVVMAGMNGREVSERLRAERPGLKVLFMSGYNDDEVVRRGIVDTPSAFLQKPFDLKTIAKRVGDVLGHVA